ncbi:4-oxalocrotonate tautomerase [Moritella viscosa]|nr:4-oxalocrotonate tautomerase [Moritella viscosa]SHO22912.1 4-oxalocrotonate tautomerase [Moritella viscosa]
MPYINININIKITDEQVTKEKKSTVNRRCDTIAGGRIGEKPENDRCGD